MAEYICLSDVFYIPWIWHFSSAQMLPKDSYKYTLKGQFSLKLKLHICSHTYNASFPSVLYLVVQILAVQISAFSLLYNNINSLWFSNTGVKNCSAKVGFSFVL